VGSRPNPNARRVANASYCFAQTITAFAPLSQLAPVVPSMRTAALPAQYALAMISPDPHDA
jgi:hypothetical protein